MSKFPAKSADFDAFALGYKEVVISMLYCKQENVK